MTTIALAGAGRDLDDLIAKATEGVYLPLSGPLDVDAGDLLRRIDDGTAPGVLILDAREDTQTALSLAQQFDRDYPQIILLLATDNPAELVLPAMRAGVRDLITPGAGLEAVLAALDSAVAASERLNSSGQQRSRVITVVSSKGGAGKTMLATNIAVALARSQRHSTVIVDLDLQFGDVATALNLTSEFSLIDALSSVKEGDAISLKSYLTTHPSGLYVLPAPENPADADAVTSEHVSQLLQMLAAEFKYVIVDTAPGLSGHTLEALDHTTDMLLLTPLSVTGLRGTRKVIDILGQLQMFTDRGVHLALNFANDSNGLSLQDAEATLQAPIAVALPISKTVPASLNLGVPLMQSKYKDPLVKALIPFVTGFLPAGATLNLSGRHRRGKGRR